MKIALFHPWIKSRGGAEKVVLEIAKSLEDVDIYTWVYDQDQTFEEFEKFKINVLSPNWAKIFSRGFLSRGIFFILSLFSKIPLEKYDYFFISTSGVGEFILFRNYKPKKTYSYVHTPLRFCTPNIIKWQKQNNSRGFALDSLYLFAIKTYNILEKIAWRRIDKAFFNSDLSKKRAIEKKLIKEGEIIYPLVDLDDFKKIRTKKGDYFLYVSRFNHPKRQDLLIEVWKDFVKTNPNKKLILAGSAESKKYMKKIREMCKDQKSIEIKENLNRENLLKLYANCFAGIFIGFEEDFGIVPFEFLALGKTLIAVNQGGYVDLIKNLPQVIWVKEEKIKESLLKSLKIASKNKIKPKKIQLIDKESFISSIRRIFKN